MIKSSPIRHPFSRPRRNGAARQDGYALLVILFLVALMAVAVTTVGLNVVTNNRREKEEEMIWRGRQYVRGIRLFYGKTHRFPTALDDLYKPKTGLRFMRQAYKDPMNTADGSWRMIYVGPNGQLIGSLKNRSVNLSGQATGGFGGAAGPGGPGMSGSNSQTGSSSFFGSSNGFGSASSFGSNNAANPPASTPPGQATTNGQPTGTDESVDPNSAQPSSISDGPIIGGNIIGVGSKINKKSIIWFEKAKNYRQYEFVWDPSVDSLTGQRPTLPTTNTNPVGSQGGTGAPPFGTNTNPNSNPTQNPNPDPNQNPPLQAPPN
jgi:hypothetical protein